MHAGHRTAAATPGLGDRLRRAVVFPYRAFLLPEYPVSTRQGREKKCALTLLDPLLTPIKSKGLFFFFFNHTRSQPLYTAWQQIEKILPLPLLEDNGLKHSLSLVQLH